MSDERPSLGQVVDGKYRVEAKLGQGGMGAVFRAVHLGTSRTVALKVIAPRFAMEPEFLQRFQREAHACGRLRHPNIVDVTDFGVDDTPEGALPYLVMEYLDGCSLSDVLRDEARLPLAWCVDVLGQVSSAVDEAHRHGILHRDLKPDNIWLEPNRRGGYAVKVLDFGLAKATPATEPRGLNEMPRAVLPREPRGSTGAAVRARPTDEAADTLLREPASPPGTALPEPGEGATRAGSVVGTPTYMSPEQIQGLTLTARSDVYSLGVIAYRMVTGRPPFTGPTEDVLKSHVHDTARPIRELRPDLPREAAGLVMSALAKDPEARPAGAVAFAEMFAARFETPIAFLHGALQVFVSHLGTWLRLSVLCFLPLLVFSLAISFASLLNASGQVEMPWLARGARALIVQAFLALAAAGGLAFGVVVVPPAMQVVAAPLRPVEIAFLLRRFAGRFRQWARTMLPVLGITAATLAWVVLSGLALRTLAPDLRPYVMSLPRPMRAAFGLLEAMLALSFPLAALHLFTRRFGGVKGVQFLSTVILVEGLNGRRAFRRAAELYDHAGKALHRAQAALGIGTLLLGLAGLTLTERLIGPGMGIFGGAPLIATLFVLGVPFPLLVGELIYLRARQAAGEPLDQILSEFERLVLPPSHWRLAHLDRVRQQIDLSR